MHRFRLYSLLILLFMSNAVQAVFISNDDYPYYFHIETFIDESKSLSFEEVVSNSAWHAQENHFTFGYSSANFWVKLNFQNLSAETLTPVLWLTETFFHEVEFYYQQKGDWSRHQLGLTTPVEQREIVDIFPNLSIELAPYSEQDIYIKLNGQFGSFGAFLLSSKKDFYTQVFSRSMVFVIIIIALVMLSLFYLVLHWRLREASFIYYSLYSLSFSVWIALYNGLFSMFSNEWLHSFLQLLIPIVFVFLVKFSQSLLDTENLTPRFHHLLNALVVLFFTAVLIIPFDVALGFMVHNLAVTMTMIVLILLSLISLRRNEKMVNLYAIGLIVYFSGMAVFALMALGILPYSVFTRNSPFPGSVIEFAIFAYILALKVFQIENDKRLSQLKVEQLRDEEKTVLEENVVQRTQQLQQSLDKQQSIVQQYSSFISLISHELRNPLGIIKSHISLIKKESEKGIDNQSKHLNTMALTTQRMEMLFDDWLTSDKLENDLLSVNLETIEVESWIYSMRGMIEQIYSTHRFKFEIHPVIISADAVLLKLALYNLIDNAVKYSEGGSLIILKAVSNQDKLLLIVEDNGCSVSDAEAELIFERFTRGSCSVEVKGAGLGLSLVRNVMELHAGEVSLDLTYRRGSRFVMSFPKLAVDVGAN